MTAASSRLRSKHRRHHSRLFLLFHELEPTCTPWWESTPCTVPRTRTDQQSMAFWAIKSESLDLSVRRECVFILRVPRSKRDCSPSQPRSTDRRLPRHHTAAQTLSAHVGCQRLSPLSLNVRCPSKREALPPVRQSRSCHAITREFAVSAAINQGPKDARPYGMFKVWARGQYSV